jgi:hypothetical protein
MSSIIPTKKLSQDTSYERPTKTITESIQTKKDIEEQLKNFEEISDEDLNFVNVNTQLKYLSYDKKNKKELFRFGGLLVKVNKDYLVLAGKDGMRFSVQRYTYNDKGVKVHTTRFFKKMKDTEILKEKMNDEIENYNIMLEQQKKEILELKKKLKQSKK